MESKSIGYNMAPLLSFRNEAEYDAAVNRLNELLDDIGNNEDHPLYGFLDTLGILIHAYEVDHFPIPDVSAADALRSLMDKQEIKENDHIY